MADEEKKVKCPPKGAPAWMCTFADLMSLLMCFFVLLLSFSELDRQKFKQVAGSMEKAFGIQLTTPADDSPRGMEMISRDFPTVPLDAKRLIMEAVVEEMDVGKVQALQSSEGVKLRVKDSVAFDSGLAGIKEDFKPFLMKIGKLTAEQGFTITVGGHTDNVPMREGGPFASNWGLSTARAVEVVEFWLANFDIPAENLAAAGFADGQPIVSNETPDGRAKNRRVEFFIRTVRDMPAFEGIRSILE
jgi:chemotaxis protein MotB